MSGRCCSVAVHVVIGILAGTLSSTTMVTGFLRVTGFVTVCSFLQRVYNLTIWFIYSIVY